MINAWRVLLYGLQGFRRNMWLSIIAVMTMVTTLITVSMVALTAVAAQQQYREFNKKIDYVLFVKDTVSDEDIEVMVTQIESRSEVDTVVVRDKNAARERFEAIFRDSPDLMGIITDDNNPLPREVAVTFLKPQEVPAFDTYISSQYAEVIQRTSYKESALSINRYLRGVEFFGRVGAAFSIFYLITAILVLLNTVRLTIYSRRSEVEVMRIVGGSLAYIRGPFIIEGLLYGLLGAVISGIVSYAVLQQIDVLVRDSFSSGASDAFRDLFGTILGPQNSGGVALLLAMLFGLQLVMGLLLGGACSAVAVRRYLKEQ